ncbi:hypothetical protein [Kitasatospora sp. GAS204B]|uniref:hypothetical protein n=1 Tax=unclassified Kitasatospora TaxID=2633591 RepID=UPI0024765625|nr:hypothetical protein [Kitasatospora sp. GAS204B]MDH6119706.1 hypothetical protein [Kitasatospora sp. GAS204B]
MTDQSNQEQKSSEDRRADLRYRTDLTELILSDQGRNFIDRYRAFTAAQIGVFGIATGETVTPLKVPEVIIPEENFRPFATALQGFISGELERYGYLKPDIKFASEDEAARTGGFEAHFLSPDWSISIKDRENLSVVDSWKISSIILHENRHLTQSQDMALYAIRTNPDLSDDQLQRRLSYWEEALFPETAIRAAREQEPSATAEMVTHGEKLYTETLGKAKKGREESLLDEGDESYMEDPHYRIELKQRTADWGYNMVVDEMESFKRTRGLVNELPAEQLPDDQKEHAGELYKSLKVRYQEIRDQGRQPGWGYNDGYRELCDNYLGTMKVFWQQQRAIAHNEYVTEDPKENDAHAHQVSYDRVVGMRTGSRLSTVDPWYEKTVDPDADGAWPKSPMPDPGILNLLLEAAQAVSRENVGKSVARDAAQAGTERLRRLGLGDPHGQVAEAKSAVADDGRAALNHQRSTPPSTPSPHRARPTDRSPGMRKGW